MHVRIKRHKTTMFIHVDPTATIAQLKAKIGEVTQQETDSQKLLKDDVALTDDAKTLADLNINTDDVLALVLKRPDGSWEEVAIEEPAAVRDG